MNVPITFACGLYDRTLPLYTGEVKPQGIDLAYEINEEPRDIFDKMAGEQAYGASEMSASELVCRIAANQCPFVAIPIFPSRVFRHGFITINKRSGIKTPKDLEGRRIGTTVYTATAIVYIRGLLQHDYGVDLSTIKWVEGDLRHAGKHGNPATMPLLKKIDIEPMTGARGLSGLLEDGEIDAIVSPSLPPCLGENPDIERLFPNFREIEKDYYRRTKIFPIMHLVAIRRDLYESHPFIAKSLHDAFVEAKRLTLHKLLYRGAMLSMLPWSRAEALEMQALFGGDFWPYGVEANRPTLEAFMTYLHEQGMIAKPFPIEDIFVPVGSPAAAHA
jgi:4,5-dihydroxyphthalate decarboxylase